MKTEEEIIQKLADMNKEYKIIHGVREVAQTWGWIKCLEWVLGD